MTLRPWSESGGMVHGCPWQMVNLLAPIASFGRVDLRDGCCKDATETILLFPLECYLIPYRHRSMLPGRQKVRLSIPPPVEEAL